MTDEEKGSRNAKIIGGLVAVAAAVGIYFFFKSDSGKSVNGLGDLNTAKTKSGKVKQRKAVFAKLDDAGKTWGKNRKGKRKREYRKI